MAGFNLPPGVSVRDIPGAGYDDDDAPTTNFPPESDPLRDRLADRYVDLFARAAALTAAANRVPQEFDAEALRRATDFVARQLKPARDELEAARVDEKAPFLASCRTVDSVFADAIDDLKAAIRAVEGKIGAHLSALAAKVREMEPLPDVTEADLVRTRSAHGSIATLRADVDFAVTDQRSAVTHVWQHIDVDALGKAIRRYIKARGPSFKKLVTISDVHESGIRFFIRRKAQTR